ncbi:MAG: hypothetical protein H5U37_01370 [Caldisericia bacterium]|nr:hypothetical protein [Caldisericia bacterium]
MKKILVTILILGLIGIIGLNGVKFVKSEVNLDLFKESAIKFIKSQEEILPQLKDSKIISPFIYKDKYGNDRTIVFGVEKECKIIGRVVINYDRDNPIFLEFAETPPPHLIDVKEVVMNKISLKENQCLKEDEYIYIFPLLFYIYFDVMEDNKKVDDLYFFLNEKKIVEFKEIPEFERIEKFKIEYPEIKGYYSKVLYDVPDYTTENTNLCNPCGPVAGANILGYWDKHGYSKLQLDGDESTGSQLTTCLWNDMGTSCVYGTSVSNFQGGIVAHTNSCFHPPYNCCYNFTTSWQRPPSYNSLIIEINNNRPLGILFGWPGITPPHPKYGYHWVVGIGYAYGSNPQYYIFYIRSGWGEGNVVLDYPSIETYIHGYVKIYPSS